MDDDGFTDTIIKTIIVGPLTEIQFYPGWNLITIPNENNWYASNLADNITSCTSISRWDALNQTYKTYIVGGPIVFDFPIEDGCGYFVDVIQNTTCNLTGPSITTVNVSLLTGWNLIGWYKSTDATASNLGGNITNCTSVSKWNATIQTYQTYIIGGPPVFDFTISRGMGIFVDVTSPSYWYGED
jgi:hypothetical protein